MSAETIPAEVHATMLWALKRWRTSMQPDDLLRAMLEAPVVQGWLADRSTRPAEPAPEVEVGDGETYYTKGKDADWFEGLSDKDAAWALTCAAMDLNDTGMGDQADRFMPHNAMLSGAGDRIKALLSTLEAERARADRNAERAEEADRLRVEHATQEDAAWAEVNELHIDLSRALQDRDEAVRVAAEDERDRLYRKANADYIAAEERGDTIAQEAHAAAAYWLGLNDGKSVDDRTIARRARLRADQRAGDGGSPHA